MVTLINMKAGNSFDILYSQERIKLTDWMPHIGLIPKVIPLKLFLFIYLFIYYLFIYYYYFFIFYF